MKSFYNFFGHSVDRRTMHSHVQQRMQETVRHLKKGIVTVSAGGPIFCIRRRPDFSMTVSACCCLLLQYLIQSCARGGRRIVEEARTCAMRYDEPRLVWTRLTTTH